jgi:hypothetical protein
MDFYPCGPKLFSWELSMLCRPRLGYGLGRQGNIVFKPYRLALSPTLPSNT